MAPRVTHQPPVGEDVEYFCVTDDNDEFVIIDAPGDALQAGAELVALGWEVLVERIAGAVLDGLRTDGAHHKQYFLERIGLALGMDLSEIEHEEGVAP